VIADEILDRVTLSNGKEMVLLRWDAHFSIHVGGRPLMSSHEHGSEDALGRIVAERLAGVVRPKVLIGGLGLGFTLRAALDALPKTARVVVVELVPEVVRWNRDVCGALAGHPLDDPRVEVIVDDVAKVIGRGKGDYDAIVLDVDNGPVAISDPGNAKLYSRAGLARARAALRKGTGILAVWSAVSSKTFEGLDTVGKVERVRAEATTPGGPRYYIWLAQRG